MAYSKSNTTNVAFNGTSISQDLSSKAKQVYLSATAGCYVSFDASIASTGNGFYIPADRQYIFDILYPAQIAVIQDSGAGTLSVMELGDSVPSMNITVQDDYTGNASLLRVISSSLSGDASLLINVAGTFTGDANLVIQNVSTTFTGDAAIQTLHVDAFSGDANMSTCYVASLTGDSHLDV